MNKKDYNTPIDRQIRELDELVEIQTEKCFDRNRLESILPYETARSIKRVVMTGCGESFSAAGAIAEAFRRISGIKAIHHPDPMEFTHYYSDFDLTKGYDRKETLVVAIGDDGSQMIRGILEREKNCHSVLITNGSDSPNKDYAENLFRVGTPEGCDTSDLRSYFIRMIALLGLASHLGKANGYFTETQEEELITEKL